MPSGWPRAVVAGNGAPSGQISPAARRRPATNDARVFVGEVVARSVVRRGVVAELILAALVCGRFFVERRCRDERRVRHEQGLRLCHVVRVRNVVRREVDDVLDRDVVHGRDVAQRLSVPDVVQLAVPRRDDNGLAQADKFSGSPKLGVVRQDVVRKDPEPLRDRVDGVPVSRLVHLVQRQRHRCLFRRRGLPAQRVFLFLGRCYGRCRPGCHDRDRARKLLFGLRNDRLWLLRDRHRRGAHDGGIDERRVARRRRQGEARDRRGECGPVSTSEGCPIWRNNRRRWIRRSTPGRGCMACACRAH